jgi:hypothetical protein
MKKLIFSSIVAVTALLFTSCSSKETTVTASVLKIPDWDSTKVVMTSGVAINLDNMYCKDTHHDCIIEYTDKTTGQKKKMEVRQFWLNNLHRYDYDYRPASLEYFTVFFVPKTYDLSKANTGGKGYYLNFKNIRVPIKRTYKKGQDRFVYGIKERPSGKGDTVRLEEAYVLNM